MKTKLLLQWLVLPGLLLSTCCVFAQADRPERVHLGDVKDKRGRVVYQVATRVYTKQAAQLQHGHGEILFLGAKGQPAATYEVDKLEDLPVALRGNILYFRSRSPGSSQSARYQRLINPAAPLPAWLCVSPGNCYHKN